MAPMRSASGVDETGAAQGHQHLVEEGPRDPLPSGDLATLERAAAGVGSQLDNGPDAVLGLHRKAHAHSRLLLKVDQTGQVYPTDWSRARGVRPEVEGPTQRRGCQGPRAAPWWRSG